MKRILRWFQKPPEIPKILVLIDFENIATSMSSRHSPENFSLEKGFSRLIEELAKLARVDLVFVFVPPHIDERILLIFQKQLFYCVSCPRTTTKEGHPKDTVDETLISLGKDLIDRNPNLTHLCIVSGDKDLAVLARHAKRQGLEVVIAAADLTSISSEMINLASIDPATGEKRVFLFSPIEKA